jgi:hypothetical protein
MDSRRTQSLFLAAITIPCGLLWRFAPLHLPPFLYKYGGSAFYAIELYWLYAAALLHARTFTLAVAAIVTSAAVEFFKLFRNPAVDSFRLTLPGKLLLGRFFSIGALIAYTVAIAAVALLDHALLRRHHRINGSKLE